MKLLEKFTQGAGIALSYTGGIASIWFGAMCTMISLAIWGIGGLSIPLSVFWVLFGITPVSGGVWLLRRGKIQKELLKVKLLKETIRSLAFSHKGRLTPQQLSAAKGYTDDQALHVLKNLAAEDPARIELQLDYQSGEIYFDFPDIRRAVESQKEYQALPISKTLQKGAIDIALTLGKTIETFREYVEYTQHSVSDRRKHDNSEKYKVKIERFLNEIEELKHQ